MFIPVAHVVMFCCDITFVWCSAITYILAVLPFIIKCQLCTNVFCPKFKRAHWKIERTSVDIPGLVSVLCSAPFHFQGPVHVLSVLLLHITLSACLFLALQNVPSISVLYHVACCSITLCKQYFHWDVMFSQKWEF